MDKDGIFEVGDRIKLKDPGRWKTVGLLGDMRKDFYHKSHVVSKVIVHTRAPKTLLGQRASIFVETCLVSWSDRHWELILEVPDIKEIMATYEVD